MGKGLWAHIWVRHIAIAVSYGLAVVLFRELSVSQWMILAGLRLSVLLLAPYRYWPALAIGESGYYVVLGYVCSGTWGVPWGIGCAIPGIVYAAPIVYWVRERWSPIEKKTINIARLLVCALLVSLAVTLRDLGLFLVIKNLPANYVVDYSSLASDYFIGNYMGVLTVTPVAIFLYQMVSEAGWYRWAKRVAGNRVIFESVCMVVPVMAFLLWLGMTASPHTNVRQIVQIAMFLPVVWLAVRHGWQGAAVGGAAASCAVWILMPPAHADYDTLRAEVIVAFAISTMLLMGGRIATLDKTASQDRADFHMALSLAQRNVYVGEMQLRMTSQALEQIRETIHSGFSILMGRLQLLQPAVDDRGYRFHAIAAQDQLHYLADSLYPVALREKGLPNALRDGAFARVLSDAGIAYSCDLYGPLSKLSSTLRMTIYRVIWDAVYDACLKRNVSGIKVRIRAGERWGRRCVMVNVYSYSDATKVADIQWSELLPRLLRATSGLGLQAVQDRAAIFEGRTRIRSLPEGSCLSILLLDAAIPGDN